MEAALNLSSVARPVPCTHGCNPYYTPVHALHGYPCMHDKCPCTPVHAVCLSVNHSASQPGEQASSPGPGRDFAPRISASRLLRFSLQPLAKIGQLQSVQQQTSGCKRDVRRVADRKGCETDREKSRY